MINWQTEISGNDGHTYKVRQLTKQLAENNKKQFLDVHNIIPYVKWEVADLLADESPKGIFYHRKWDLSAAVFDNDLVVGILIAYLREASDTHPLDAIYIHRLAIAVDYQGVGIGHQLMRAALNSYARIAASFKLYRANQRRA